MKKNNKIKNKKSKKININLKDKRILLITIISISCLLLLISTSAAMLLKSASSSKKDLFSTGDLVVEFNDANGDAINLNPTKPVSDEYGSTLDPYKFTIENKGTYPATYTISITNEVITNPNGLSNEEVKSNIKYKVGNSSPGLLSSASGNKIANGIIGVGEKKEIDLRLWITYFAGNEMQNTTYKGKIAISGKAVRNGTANTPELASGMIPVIYDDEKDKWVKADINSEWYNYDKGMWANAVTVSRCVGNDEYSGYDITGDGIANKDDSNIISKYWNVEVDPTNDEQVRADVNGDGKINAIDLSLINSNFNKRVCANKTQKEYLDAPAGTVIEMENINTMWVWIPRFKYKIPSNIGSSSNVDTPPMIDVIFETGLSATGVTESVYRNGMSTTNTNYYTHPAFRDGSKVYNTTAYDIGGWDKELTGMWVGKFETGTDYETKYFYDGEEYLEKEYTAIKPDVISLTNQNVSTQFTTSLKLAGGVMDSTTGKVTFSGNTNYGLTSSTDTHMMKNTEWGMVAILSQSKYGKMGNSNYIGANKEVYINNSSSKYTGRSGGGPGSSSISSTTYGSYSYNDKACSSTMCTGNKTTNAGRGASTTGTIYGIYDMSGGANEYTFGNWNGYAGYSSSYNSGFNGLYYTPSGSSKTDGINFPEAKYYDKYTKGDGSNGTITKEKVILGDATWETMKWYQDYAYFPHAFNPFSLRGGNSNNTSDVGVFYSSSNFYSYGYAGTDSSFRLSLIP